MQKAYRHRFSDPNTDRRSLIDKKVRKLTFWEKHVGSEIFFSVLLGLVLGGLGTFIYQQTVHHYEILITPPESEPTAILEYGAYPQMTDYDFFTDIRDQFIEENGSFLEADLSTMEMTVYQKGEAEMTVAIAAKGREGSWWETPAGLYSVQSKNRNHFSSLASVYMPWSIHFHGDFFIHGWPYHPDGRPVVSDFSGGCVRLTDEDAKKIYDSVNVGMPVLVHKKQPTDQYTYSAQPNISAEKFMAVDLANNHLFFDQNRQEKIEMFSAVHLLSALVGVEHINLEKANRAIIDRSTLVETLQPRLQTGQRLSFYHLLFPLLMESSNEAAKAIAQIRGEELFIRWLNQKAAALGMNDTELKEVVAGKRNQTTSQDLFTLIRYIYQNRSFILDISALEDGAHSWSSVYGDPRWDDLTNHHPLAEEDGFRGGISDIEPDSSGSMISLIDLEINSRTRPILFIIHNSTDPVEDTRSLKQAISTAYSLSKIPTDEE